MDAVLEVLTLRADSFDLLNEVNLISGLIASTASERPLYMEQSHPVAMNTVVEVGY